MRMLQFAHRHFRNTSKDCLADKLVDVLDFLGIVLRIPNSIMGLTVLAWGNSMADLSANVTMARKGLANMAITVSVA